MTRSTQLIGHRLDDAPRGGESEDRRVAAHRHSVVTAVTALTEALTAHD